MPFKQFTIFGGDPILTLRWVWHVVSVCEHTAVVQPGTGHIPCAPCLWQSACLLSTAFVVQPPTLHIERFACVVFDGVKRFRFVSDGRPIA